MSDFLSRFDFNSVKLNGELIACLVLIWMLVVACGISSIVSLPFDRKQRSFWICVVVGLPVIGMLAYLPFAFRSEDLPHFLHIKKADSRRRQRGKTREA